MAVRLLKQLNPVFRNASAACWLTLLTITWLFVTADAAVVTPPFQTPVRQMVSQEGLSEPNRGILRQDV